MASKNLRKLKRKIKAGHLVSPVTYPVNWDRLINSVNRETESAKRANQDDSIVEFIEDTLNRAFPE